MACVIVMCYILTTLLTHSVTLMFLSTLSAAILQALTACNELSRAKELSAISSTQKILKSLKSVKIGNPIQIVMSSRLDRTFGQITCLLVYFVIFGRFKILGFLFQLLKRVFDIMRAKNPTMTEGGKKKFVMKPPQVVRIGTKKTSFVNFADICRILHRQPKHLLAFLLAELGTRFLIAYLQYIVSFMSFKVSMFVSVYTTSILSRESLNFLMKFYMAP